MTEFWQALAVILTITGVVNGLSIFANRTVLSKAMSTHKDEYKDRLQSAAKQCEELASDVRNTQSIERQLLELKADLPLSYVRKEDFIRHEVAINAKLDRIYEVLSNKQGG